MTTKTTVSPDAVGARRTHPGGTPQKWTLTDHGRKLIEEHYDGTAKCLDALQKRLKVPRYMIRRWAKEIGLTHKTTWSHWSDEEVQYLEEHVNSVSPEKIAEYLGRTKNAVQIKARNLGFDIDDGYTLKELTEGFGCSHTTSIKWVKQGWLKGTRRAFDETTWSFSDKNIKDFLRAHPDAIDLRRVNQLWFLDLCLDGIGRLDNPSKIEYSKE